MKFIRAIALLLVIFMLSSLLLGCNETTEQSSIQSNTTSTTAKKTQSTNKVTTSYSKELPKVAASLPLYNGKEFSFTDFSLGQSSVMHITVDTNKEEYATYLDDVEEHGYELYTKNTIGENLFATFINDTHILNVMYIDAFKQARVICDEREKFDLPGLESENVYEETSDSSLTLLADEAVGWPGRMGYIYKLADGSFFIIDGGYTSTGGAGNSSKPYIMAVLEKYADDPNNITVAAWLLTHTHEDHTGGFIDMSYDKSIRDRIHIEKVICNTPSAYMLSKQDTGMPKWANKLDASIKMWNPDAVIKAHPGQVFYLRNLKLTVYHSQDLIIGAPFTSEPYLVYHYTDKHNDTSIVSMVEFMGKKALYMADCHAKANTYAVAPVYKEELKADILQVAHHGYGDTAAGHVYQYVEPSIVFWPVCRQHYDGLNNDGTQYYENGNAYNGVMYVSFNQEYLYKEGIVHYYHGGECITFNDFETWEGVRWDAVP